MIFLRFDAKQNKTKNDLGLNEQFSFDGRGHRRFRQRHSTLLTFLCIDCLTNLQAHVECVCVEQGFTTFFEIASHIFHLIHQIRLSKFFSKRSNNH